MRTINTKLSKIIGGVLLMAAPAITYGQGTTQLVPEDCGTTVATLDEWLSAEKVPNATDYEFKIVDSEDGTTATRVKGNKYPSFNMTYFPVVSYGRTYNVSVRAFANGSWGSFGSECSVTTPAFPKTKLSSNDCGRILTTLNTMLVADPVTHANNYEWKFVNGTNVEYIKGNRYSSLNIANIGLAYETVYSVQVRARVGDYWGEYGEMCEITTPAFPTTKLTDDYCGQAIYSTSAPVVAYPVVGASDYEWKFKDLTNGAVYTQTKGNKYSSFIPSAIPEIKSKRDYEVQVRAQVGGEWGEFGEVCALRILEIPATKLADEYCGYTLNTLDEFIHADAVQDAMDYQFEFTDKSTGIKYIKNKGNEYPSFKLTYVSGLTYGKTYEVRVRAMIDGTWGPYGEICEVTTPAFPQTKLADEYCGSTVDRSDMIHAEVITGAETYEWKFSDGSNTVTYIKGNKYSSLLISHAFEFYNLTTGTYNVTVRAKVGDTWGEFGESCVLTITDNSEAEAKATSVGTIPVVERKATVDIYPNPSLGNNVNLNLSNLASNGDEITVNVIDMSGKIVYSKKLNNNGENINTNLAFDTKLASGSYIVSVTAGAENFHHKMIVR